MANAIYPQYKQKLLANEYNLGTANSNTNLVGSVVKCALVDTGTYTYNAADSFYNDVSGVVGTPIEIANTKTVTNGTFDGADITFSSVTGATVEALVIYIEESTNDSSPLVAYIDTGVTGLPVTPNGGDITVQWNASGIFTI
jgi:hypothetical protein